MEIFPIFQESKASSISICIRLEESGVITDCRIRTINFDPVLEYDFGSANVIGRIIMSSECLKEVFCELDSTSETMQLSMSPDSPHFRISTFGHSGVYHVSFKNQYLPTNNFYHFINTWDQRSIFQWQVTSLKLIAALLPCLSSM